MKFQRGKGLSVAFLTKFYIAKNCFFDDAHNLTVGSFLLLFRTFKEARFKQQQQQKDQRNHIYLKQFHGYI